jgi:hypothetical protein
MQVFVRNQHGQRWTFHVEPNHSVLSIKQKILEQEGIPIRHQLLMHAGKNKTKQFNY